MKQVVVALALLCLVASATAQDFEFPSSPGEPYACTIAEAGDAYYDTVTSLPQWCDGSAWQDFGTSGATTGTGTANKVTKWTGASTLGDSGITDTTSGVTAAAFTNSTWNIGGYDDSSPGSSTLSATDAIGTDVGGGANTVRAGQGTGNANGGSLLFRVAPRGAASGSSQNTLQTAFSISGADGAYTLGGVDYGGGGQPGGSIIRGADAATGQTNTAGGQVTFQSGASTGNVGSTLSFMVSPAGASGTAQNAPSTRAQFTTDSYFIGGVQVPNPGAAGGASLIGGYHSGTGQTDTAGAGFIVQPGFGRGTAASGVLQIRTAPRATGSSATLNTAQDAINIQSTGDITIGGLNIAAGTVGTVTLQGADSATGRSNTAGGDTYVTGGQSTGNANGGSVHVQVASAGVSGTAQNALTTRLTADTVGVVIPSGQWLRQVASRSYLSSDYTNATASMTNTALSITVKSGRKYTFKCILYLADSVAADGAVIDFDGGTATATNFRVHGTLFDTALILSAQSSALATDFATATVTGDAMAEFHGSFEPSADGTFIVRASQNAHTTGTLTIYRGAVLVLEDVTGS